MPAKKTFPDLRLEVSPPRVNLMKDTPVPYPSVEGAALPRRFDSAVRDLDNGCTAQLEVVVHDGRPRIRSLVLTGDTPLTPTDIRRLPLGAYLETAVATVVMKATVIAPGNVSITPMDYGEVVGTMTRARVPRQKRAPITPATLERVAAAYNAAPRGQRTQHVADELDVEPGWARQLVMKARNAKLLPPTGRKA